MIISKQGELYFFGYNRNALFGFGDFFDRLLPTLLPDFKNITHVSMSVSNAFIHTKEGDKSLTFGVGLNEFGQLCQPVFERTLKFIPIPNTQDFVSFSNTNRGSFHLKKTGQVYGCGFNFDGSLGIGDFSPKKENLTLIPSLFGVTKVASSTFFTVVLSKNNDQLYAIAQFWGMDLSKPQPIHSLRGTALRIFAGHEYTLVLTTNGLFGFGENDVSLQF